MKVALVHLRHAATGGTERYLNHLASHLAEAGHDVAIVCRRHAQAPHPAVRFAVLRSPAIGASWRLWAFARDVEAHVRSEDYDVVLGLGKTWTHDVLRMGGGLHATYLALAHEETRTPLERLLGLDRLKHRLALAIERRALAPGAAARVIVNAEMVRRDLLARHALPPERVVVIQNGVDLERFHPRLRAARGEELRRALGIGAHERAILFLGTGYARKGLDVLLEAFPRVARARPEARLVVVGHDSRRARYEARARALGIAERTRFLGGRGDAEACYAAADLYALPTRYDPFANATLEALASGLPVVTTPANGGGELLSEDLGRRAGRVVEAGPEPLAAALQELLPAGRSPCAAARALAERHSIESKMALTTALLEAVAAERAGSGARAP